MPLVLREIVFLEIQRSLVGGRGSLNTEDVARGRLVGRAYSQSSTYLSFYL